jgi:diguanylate cyclase (GGDEF)-like protein
MSITRRAAQNIDAFPDLGEQTSPAMQAVNRAWRYQYSDLREARASAANAVSLAEESQDSRALAYALFQSAYASIRIGMSDEATTHAAECRALFEALQDDRGVWLARAIESLCLRLDGEADKSIRLLQELAAHPPLNATSTDLFVVHVALSLGYRYLGLLEPALKWHYQAVDTARDTTDQLLLASTLCNLGGYHTDLHNPEEGCRLLEEGLTLASSCDADRTTIIIALNLAQTYAMLGRHDEALALAEKYLTAERYILAIGASEPEVPLTLALAYANANRPDDAGRVFDSIRGELVRSNRDAGTPQVFWTYVEARIALAAGAPLRTTEIALATLDGLDEAAVDSPSYLMNLHATTAAAYEAIGDHQRALFHERRRATIYERLARLAAHVAGLTHTIRHELDTTRAERDRVVVLHAELEREHERLATLNGALKVQIAENQRLHDELKEQNYRDALTGLHNRRYLYERGPRLLAKSIEEGTSLCLVMLDLDHFKYLNDLHGHVVGDRVLVALGKLLRDSLREGDIVCRVGGEEFAMILPSTSATVARERLTSMLDDCRRLQTVEGDGPLPTDLTFSAGIAKAHEHHTTIDALMIAADRLLYKAKNDGRSRIESMADDDFTPSASSIARQPIDH